MPAIPSDIAMRPARNGDQEAIATMMHTCERAYFGTNETPLSATLEWIHNTWNTSGFDLEADSLVAVTPDEQIVGYVTTWRAEHEPQRIIASPRIHPDYHGRGLGAWMLHWSEQRAKEIANTQPRDLDVQLFSWVVDVDSAAKALLARESFEPIRYWWQMEISLETDPPIPAWPEGIRIRQFVSGQDEQATYDALFEAFQTNGDDPYDTFEEWLRFGVESESFDPSLWFLAIGDDGKIAGVILGDLRQDSQRGWISEVAVRPLWRKRGLALALLYQAFGAFYRRDIHQCALSVDAANPSGATRLYERAGMQPNNRTDIRYQKEIRPVVRSN